MHTDRRRGDVEAHRCPRCGKGPQWDGFQLGGLGDAAGEAALAKVAGDLNKVIADLVAEIKAAPTNAALYKLLQPQLDRAVQFQSTGLAPSTLAVKVAALRTARNHAKIAYSGQPNDAPTDAVKGDAAVAAAGPLQWLAGVTGQSLAKSNADADLVRSVAAAIKHAPTAVVGWALESAGATLKNTLAAVGLPAWLVPVVLIGAGLVVVAPYAAPMIARAVGGSQAGYHASRRTNPRRRRYPC